MWRAIRRFFNRVKPAPKPVEVSVDKEFKTVWGQIICHEKHKSGANTWDKKLSEYRYGNILAPLLKMLDEDRTGRGVYAAAKALVKQGVTCSVEPHFNSYNGKARFAEILVLKGDKLSAMYARRIIQEYRIMFPDRGVRGDGGIKWLKKGARGYYNLLNAKNAGMKVAILPELFFGDNKNDYITPEQQSYILNKALLNES